MLPVDQTTVLPGIAAPPESRGSAANVCVSPTKFNGAGLAGVTLIDASTCRTTSGTLSWMPRATTSTLSIPVLLFPVTRPVEEPIVAMAPGLKSDQAKSFGLGTMVLPASRTMRPSCSEPLRRLMRAVSSGVGVGPVVAI